VLDKWYLFGIVPAMGAQQATTEQGSKEFTGIDTWADAEILAALIDGQERAIESVHAAIPAIAKAASAIAECLSNGGRLFYAGAGTSIRVGVQDGSELSATFGMAEEKIGYLIAGGREAMFDTLADAEDDAGEGARAASALKAGDALIAIAASGTTPYTVAAAKRGRELGATVIAIVNNQGSPLGAASQFEILLNSGPEVIAGSTRMGAGTAQKAAVNLLSTLTHIKLGAVHDGMMVNVVAGNQKLMKRARVIVARIAAADEEAAGRALGQAEGAVKPAILICRGAGSIGNALALLKESGGNLRRALARLETTR